MLVDTHAHLFFEDFKDDLDLVLARARAAGVEKIIVPGTSVETSRLAVELAKKYPGIVYAAAGVHPEEVAGRSFNSDKVRPSLASSGWALPSRSDLQGAVAVGEIGIDLYTEEMKAKLSVQRELFRSQCMKALEHNLPIIIHTRNSFAEVWEVLSSLPKMPRGQFHCFSVDPEALSKVLAAGFYISFAGNISWSKRVARMVPLVPPDRLLLETDSPLMVPRDKKGKPSAGNERNEPANVRITAQIIADLRGVSLEVLGEQTTANAKRLFNL